MKIFIIDEVDKAGVPLGVGEGGGDPDAKKDFLRCIGLLKTNALEVQMGKARALFPTFSFLSHSCLNNAR